MKNIDSDFFLTAHKFWKTVVDKETTVDPAQLQAQIEAHKRLLNVFQAGNYFYMIFNMYTGNVDFVSSDVKEILGYEQEEISAAFMMDKMHPDDKTHFLNFEYKVVEFFKALPYDKIPYYKVQYDFRIKKRDGQYLRILHQAVQIDYDEDNFYRTLCLETDITHIKQEGVPCFSIIGLDGEASYYNIQPMQVFTKSYDLFTRRERDILKGIIEGKTSQEMAAQMFISIHTVNAHRKNILAKAGVKTALELVNKSVKEGWV
ncbi:LuxR C-terminal-related transcriptional regulator [Pedobacter sp. ASV28]|uniref:LuxR C-terminal-related transcriptional regulator n=1 Tax=Pedobacter sp. ASV28 TaxID=2795123 RepID=UPI0018EE292B|nr:LuxR C-terminal-related transcriptional regulator [Pedobacter sp. ASV28]